MSNLTESACTHNTVHVQSLCCLAVKYFLNSLSLISQVQNISKSKEFYSNKWHFESIVIFQASDSIVENEHRYCSERKSELL